MADSVGKIKCPQNGCSEIADIRKDKRGKYYLQCDTHGQLKYNTNKAQDEIKVMLEQGDASEQVNGIKLGVDPEPAPVIEDAKLEPEKKEKSGGGLPFVLLAVGVGVIAWLTKRKVQTKSIHHPNV